MPIYTRTGDAGDTALVGGTRASKASARVEAYGALDEAVCAVGSARVVVSDPDLTAVLRFLQQRMMNCAGALASPGLAQGAAVSAQDVAALESAIDRFTARVGGASGFVLPAGSEAAARLHVARATTRRAERRAVALAAEAPVDPLVRAFLNRASDLLYAAALLANALAGVTAEQWDRATEAPPLG